MENRSHRNNFNICHARVHREGSVIRWKGSVMPHASFSRIRRRGRRKLYVHKWSVASRMVPSGELIRASRRLQGGALVADADRCCQRSPSFVAIHFGVHCVSPTFIQTCSCVGLGMRAVEGYCEMHFTYSPGLGRPWYVLRHIIVHTYPRMVRRGLTRYR